MTDNRPMFKVALVHDALPVLGGAERVLETVAPIYPQAPIYTLLYRPDKFAGSTISEHEIHTSFINKTPFAWRFYRYYLPLLPYAVEQFDLRPYDIILSFSYAVAHGVLVQPDQLHISYTYTPMRQAWRAYHQFLSDIGMKTGFAGLLYRWILHYFRQWDYAAAGRVDEFIAVSQWAASCIWRAYRRPAEVIYPPVDTERLRSENKREEHYITVARLEAHKRVGLIVEAFNRLKLPLVVVGDGQLFKRIRRLAGPTVQMLGHLPDDTVAELLSRARAYIHAAEDDFGITPVEAQAAGCPVIAYGRGGVRETVVEGKTGMLFRQQNVESLMEAVELFEAESARFDRGAIQANAQRFGRQRFQREFSRFVEQKWEAFRGNMDAGGKQALRRD